MIHLGLTEEKCLTSVTVWRRVNYERIFIFWMIFSFKWLFSLFRFFEMEIILWHCRLFLHGSGVSMFPLVFVTTGRTCGGVWWVFLHIFFCPWMSLDVFVLILFLISGDAIHSWLFCSTLWSAVAYPFFFKTLHFQFTILCQSCMQMFWALLIMVLCWLIYKSYYNSCP